MTDRTRRHFIATGAAGVSLLPALILETLLPTRRFRAQSTGRVARVTCVTIIATAAVSFGAGGCAPSAKIPEDVAGPLAIEVVTGGVGSVSAHYLYTSDRVTVIEGHEVEFIGQFANDGRVLRFRDPPWVHVACEGGERDGVFEQQAFAVRPNRMPESAADGDVFRVLGTIARNRPDLAYHERENANLHHFNLTVTRIEPIKVAVDNNDARRTFAREVLRAEHRLQAICQMHGLVYVAPRDSSPNVNWYEGKIAVTDLMTDKPIYSRTPVPYATVSVLINPADGNPVKLIVQRCAHRDPPD